MDNNLNDYFSFVSNKFIYIFDYFIFSNIQTVYILYTNLIKF